MREILFRGKTNKGEWVQGSLILADNYCCILEKEENLHPIDVPYLNGEYGTFDGGATPIIPKTIGQYTGLTDKNGKKIFEGDICRFREWTNGDMCWIGKVYYEYQQFVISGNKNKECETPFTLAMSRFIPENIEVIGNIHDNPELLKSEVTDNDRQRD